MPNNNDIEDSEKDKEYLQPDEATINLPDVEDIPGQEHIQPPPLGMLADTTISSADEEGENVFENEDDLATRYDQADESNENDDNDNDIVMGTEADITEEDKRVLETAEEYFPTRDEDNLHNAFLDNTDFEGQELNEKGFGEELSGADLDMPTDNDIKEEAKDALGKVDEENAYFSLGGEENETNENKS